MYEQLKINQEERPEKMVNIRSKQGSNQTIRLDLLAKEEIKHIRQYFLRSCNHNPTTTVLVRRAINRYVDFIDNLQDPSEELYMLKDRASGMDTLEIEPVKPLEGWKTFDEKLVVALEKLKELNKQGILTRRTHHE